MSLVTVALRHDVARLLEETAAVRARFVDRLTATETGCWEWSGHRNDDGYGILTLRGVLSARSARCRAHRLAWLLFRGELPPGVFVCHRCDNPPCCNPDHLFIGTALDNTRDMIAKGRDRNLPQRERGWERLRSKTHCPSGHPYSGDNLSRYTRGDGYVGRRCLTCHREHERKKRIERKSRAA